jgi:hypothetical protein
VPEYDRKASIIRRLCPTGGCYAMRPEGSGWREERIILLKSRD